MLKTIIIDDEQDSLKAMEHLLCRHQEEIEVVKSCDNPAQGIAGIRELKPDLVFLDIEMPRMNGFQLLDTIKDISLEIIFITAYNQYAIQAVRYSALAIRRTAGCYGVYIYIGAHLGRADSQGGRPCKAFFIRSLYGRVWAREKN